MSAKYDDGDLDRIAELWASGAVTIEISRRLKIPHGSVCRLARSARLRGDDRFEIRVEPARSASKRTIVKKKPALPEVRFVNPTIFELKPNECKYPVTSGDSHRHRFCAKPRRPDRPYCAEHTVACNAGVYVRRRR